MSDDSSIVASQTVPVVILDDVAQEWSLDIYDPQAPAPLIVAMQNGQLQMLLGYQDAGAYAAAQSDPSRATAEYLDECGWERQVFRQKGEQDSVYRTRLFNLKTVDPEDIVAAANAVLAPYTPLSACYFEHADAWHVRGTYLDIVGATNTSPIQISTRWPLPPFILNSGTVTVSSVGGNTNANGTWAVTVVMGAVTSFYNGAAVPPTVTLSGTPASSAPIQLVITSGGAVGAAQFIWTTDGVTFSAPATAQSSVILGATGMSAAFSAGSYFAQMTYQAAPSALSLNTSTGNAAYTGGGSLLTSQYDPVAKPGLWSSHVFAAGTNKTPNYGDRYYSVMPHRRPIGARAFSSPYGRVFWLQVPDISGIDTNVNAAYSVYLDIVGISNTTPITVTTRWPLPPWLTSGATVTIADATVSVGGVLTNSAANGNWLVTVTGTNTFTIATGAGPSVGNGPYSDNAGGPGGGSVIGYVNTYLPGGFFAGGLLTLPGSINVAFGSPGTLDATHTLARCNSGSGVCSVTFPAAPVNNMQVAVEDTGNSVAPQISLVGNGFAVEVPFLPGTFAFGTSFSTTQRKQGYVWKFKTSDNQWHLNGANASYVWNVSATSIDIYNAVVNAVEVIRGQSIRWGLAVEPALAN